jgi:hypothetical protein
MSECRPCLIGQVFVDYVESQGSPPSLRLGGIMHAARALWAMKVPFGLAYIAPDYLKSDAETSAREYGALHIRQIGTISRCPNVVIVGEGKEIGHQRYEYLLRDQSNCDLHADALKDVVAAGNFTDFLIFPGGFPLAFVLDEISGTKANVFADINFVAGDIKELSTLRRRFSSLILSTSSELFVSTFKGDPQIMKKDLVTYSNTILLKENRGGTRFFRTDDSDCIATPAQIRAVLHSVGVGDFFDAVFIVEQPLHGSRAALAYASFAAAEYASYFNDDSVRQSVAAVLDIPPENIQQFGGVSLPWELRPRFNIYLAAPDFDDVNTAPLDSLASALTYHNFSPHRPVKEHGQMKKDSSTDEKRSLAEADLGLLARCGLMIAVLLYDDPGTFIEIGIALERKIPVIVFDPFARASNLMLTELPVLVSSDLGKVIAEVFVQAAKLT